MDFKLLRCKVLLQSMAKCESYCLKKITDWHVFQLCFFSSLWEDHTSILITLCWWQLPSLGVQWKPVPPQKATLPLYYDTFSMFCHPSSPELLCCGHSVLVAHSSPPIPVYHHHWSLSHSLEFVVNKGNRLTQYSCIISCVFSSSNSNFPNDADTL